MGIGNEREDYHGCQAVQHKRYDAAAYEADHHACHHTTGRRLVFRLGIDPSGRVARDCGGYKDSAPENYLHETGLRIIPPDANRYHAGSYENDSCSQGNYPSADHAARVSLYSHNRTTA